MRVPEKRDGTDMAQVTVRLTLQQANLVQDVLQLRSKELWDASRIAHSSTSSAVDRRKMAVTAQSIDRVLTEFA